MKYALNLGEDGRVLSASFVSEYTTSDFIVVDELPEGDVVNYLYVDGQYIYDPLPEPELPEAEPTTDDVLNALLGVTL